jgi:hypothetical protein
VLPKPIEGAAIPNENIGSATTSSLKRRTKKGDVTFESPQVEKVAPTNFVSECLQWNKVYETGEVWDTSYR